MSTSGLSESIFVHLSVMINFTREKPRSTTADCGTNKHNDNRLLIFGKAALITESPSKFLTVSGACFFSWITCNSLSILSTGFCELYFFGFS